MHDVQTFKRKFEPFEWISHMANFGGYGVPYTKGYLRTVLPVFTLAITIGVPITCVALSPITCVASSPADGCCYGYFISAWVKFRVCRLLKKVYPSEFGFHCFKIQMVCRLIKYQKIGSLVSMVTVMGHSIVVYHVYTWPYGMALSCRCFDCVPSEGSRANHVESYAQVSEIWYPCLLLYIA